MQYRKLGHTGLDVSLISFGSWVSFDYQLGIPQAKEIMQACYESGVNFFDNAEVYAHGKSEEIMGAALYELISEGNFSRSDIILSTKIYFGATKEPTPTAKGLSRKHIIEGLKDSLRRLNVDYVDVVFAHRPDPTTPIEETVRAFNWVIEQGWAFYWGTSEWPVEAIQEAHAIAERLNLIPPCVEQPQYNLLHRHRVEVEYAPLYGMHSSPIAQANGSSTITITTRGGMGLTTFSPLACGLLTGKYGTSGTIPPGSRFSIERYKFLADRWLLEDKLKKAEALRPLAAEIGATPAQLALAWCAANPRVSTVLTGATRVEQVYENVKALEFVGKLTPEFLKRIDEALDTSPTLTSSGKL
ncbi:hypothetical protein Ndes2526B_g07813 [Nannochloris sp. 'desiccata']